MIENKVVAMLLAGGQGSRLKALTSKIAKPAVPFGGKYRIIDFALSNAANSRILDIGVLTQYKPYLLNTHLGIGLPWDYDRNEGGLRVLSPFTSEDGGRWFTGTANAIYENIDFIDDLDPEYVLILSGDHIYKMDYHELLKAHIEKKADVTLAVIRVPLEEASRFGIVNVDEDNKIYEFDEKPKVPKNDMASMGIYMFNWVQLREYLLKDSKDHDSEHDFGKNVLPNMLSDDKKMYAWMFDGYWKDVGTVRSYWEAHMDLLDENNTLNIFDKKWRIFTKPRNLPPQYIQRGAEVQRSLINEGCWIRGDVHDSILSGNVTVGKGSKINKSVIHSDCVIEDNVQLNNVIVAEGVTIKEGTVIGEENDDNIYLITSQGYTTE